ncbi:Enoyl-CoA hydratase/carnithine racemase [Actinopolyspora alba]|uniref:Enoyl-CoA hydratase/carnithine racemase n=1 Tax=Actinopolyspora alba TaxID=673379 RepID=A0A1I1YMH7_9ACTN|nr:enoyl-CoA hydratase/isomerase family protein [Actinopolyspora alba]SFE20619.1 Enoyl-CoA hydratase/carnithine racemase [Actinopolyspora alba]
MTESAIDPGVLDRGHVRLMLRGSRATIVLDRPDQLNAQTPDTWKALREIGQNLAPEVRVVVVRGEGRAFSAGLDRRLFESEQVDGAPGLLSLASSPVEQGDAEIAAFQQGFSWLRDPERVTIAAVRGHAIGAGFQLALACDMRVLATDAKLRMAETSLGLVPDLGGTLPLVRAVGYSRAVEMCLTGREVDADEASRIGLANSVVEPEHLEDATDQLVEAIIRSPTGAVRETLALLSQAEEAEDPEQQFAAERAAQLRRLRELMGGSGGE